MALSHFFIACFALLGHSKIWVVAFNRLLARNLPRKPVKICELGILILLALGPVVFLGWTAAALLASRFPMGLATSLLDVFSATPVEIYLAVCVAAAAWAAPVWIWRFAFDHNQDRQATRKRRHLVLAKPSDTPLATHLLTRLLTYIPGNQVLELEVNTKELRLARLPAKLHDFTIAHISDLHISGQFSSAFYERVVEEVNAMQADLVVVTGDILESKHCLDWIPHTLGRLHCENGVFFILGNHDLRIGDTQALRNRLENAGLIDLGGKSRVLNIRGTNLFLAGNERPWFEPLPVIDQHAQTADFRLLLSHTPDQIDWARKHDFDLMLAGHTHGGQIRLPWTGPIVAPSRYDARFASGLFHLPPTLLHVSRGVSGIQPLRLNCRPEISRLVLQSAAPPKTTEHAAGQVEELAASHGIS